VCPRSFVASLTLSSALVVLPRLAQASPLQPETQCDAVIERQNGTASKRAALGEGEKLVVKGACRTEYHDGRSTEIHGAAELAISRVRCNRLVPIAAYSPTRVLDAVTDVVQPSGFRRLDPTPPGLDETRAYQHDTPSLGVGSYVVTWAGVRVAGFTVGAAGDIPRCPELDVAVTQWSPPPPFDVPRVAETEPEPRAREHWEDRKGWAWEVGAGPWLSWLGRPERGTGLDPFVGGTLSVGLHYTMPPRHASHSEKGGDFDEVEGMRWCVPIMLCFGVGMLFAPSDAFLGNELGVDARIAVGPELARGTLRGLVRYSNGIFRTPAFVSLFVPEVGIEWRRDRGSGLVIGGSLYPVDVRLPGGFAVGLDALRIGVVFGPERRAMVEIGPELTFRYAP
jgi:hypothetical protein